MYISGTISIVTGGAQGIGKRLAEALVSRGGKVVLGDIQDKGSDVADELNAKYGMRVAVFHKCDFQSPHGIQALVSQAVGEFGALNIFINAASTHGTTPWSDTNGDSISRTIDINLKAPIEATRVAVRHFRTSAQKGCIVNVLSMAAFVPEEIVPVYTAAMHGLVGFTASCATLALGTPPIRVNSVAPATTFMSGGQVGSDEVIAQVMRCISDESLAGDTIKMPVGQSPVLYEGTKAKPTLYSKL
ncbi:hypothetical protein IWW37_003661 [Coemansia sp. RSA 2050]|nr:hypothetical protein IWW37_003661 [Coemansia sp. RSA 2050]KAJ2732660.1 hypothetical protein IW152_003625 [Coemansia sp. BCRC 34962]